MSINGGVALLDQIEITLKGTNGYKTVYLDIFDNSLSRKWLPALNNILENNYHLEKNYCFMGFIHTNRNGEYILDQVNSSIAVINSANLGYTINDHFSMENCFTDDPTEEENVGRNLVREKLNNLHRYFEELQGFSGQVSEYYKKADSETRWHIRQLNLLCHEFESWALSYRKLIHAPEWQRPSQLMCWLNSPRFILDEQDLDLFGIETINRSLGGIYVGVNKAVGKHHWEVFNDEGRDSRIGELITTTLRSQSEAAADFDIEWANNPGNFSWQKDRLREFREWLKNNNFDPDDKSLTIGHPQIGQVDLRRSFGTDNYKTIWAMLENHLDVFSVKTTQAYAEYNYHWSDSDFVSKQIMLLDKR